MRVFLSELKERRFWRVLIAYPSVTFVLLQAVEFFINNYSLDSRWLTATMVAAVVLFPAAVIWNWRHGEVGQQAFAALEVTTYVASIALAVIAVSWYWNSSTPRIGEVDVARSETTRLAVMPFATPDETDDLAYLGDGIAESLINWLARSPKMQVTPKSASFRERDSNAELAAVAERLGVDRILTGELRRAGANIVVSASLTNVRDGVQDWGERFQSPAGESIQLERDIVDALTKSLRLAVTGSSNSVVASGGTQNPEAYDAYLRGHYLIQSTNASRIGEGLDELRRAIEIDPSFGLPYADIADALSQSIFYGVVDDRALFGEARNAARSAVALASESPEAHVAAATMHQYVTFDWAAAEKNYETALSLQPRSPAPYHRYADFLWTTLRLERAKEVAQMALAADPLDGSAMHAVGITQLFAGEFAKAAGAFGEWNRFHPESRWSYVKYSLALSLNGQCDAALERGDSVLELLGREPSMLMESWLAWGYHVCGRSERYAASRKRFESFIAEDPESLEPGLAYYFLLEGDTERLLALVRRIIGAESPLTMFLPVFTLGGMGWSDDDLPDRQALLNELLRALNFPPGDFT